MIIRGVVIEIDTSFRTIGPICRDGLALYIGNHATERILLQPIRAHVLDIYSKFAAMVETAYSAEEDRAVIGLPALDHAAMALGF